MRLHLKSPLRVLNCNVVKHEWIRQTREHSSSDALPLLFLLHFLFLTTTLMVFVESPIYSLIGLISASYLLAEMDVLAGPPWGGCSPALHSAAATAHCRWCRLRCRSWAHEGEKTTPSTPVDRKPGIGNMKTFGQSLWPIRGKSSRNDLYSLKVNHLKNK